MSALLEAPPPHPALSSRLLSKEPDAWRLQSLPVRYRGAIDHETHWRPLLRELGEHTLFVGATGSGKTTAMQLHMRSILPPHVRGFSANYRALVYDAKTDMLPFFGEIGFTLEQHLILTNPFDERATAWNLAADITNVADSSAFSQLLVQKHPGDTNPFWQNAARSLVSATIDGLNVQHEDGRSRYWDLRHLVLILDEPDLLREVLERTSQGRSVLRASIQTDDERTRSNVRSTVHENLAPYRLMAALWDHARYSFSFDAWLRGGGIFLIGEHEKYEDEMRLVNNLLVRFAIATVMGRPGRIEHDLTWFYLDELKNAGTFPKFGSLLTKGRSKGLRAVLSVQGLSTLRATFREAEVHEVLNNCAEKCVMQLGTEADAKWAEGQFSTTRRVRLSRTKPEYASPNDRGTVTYREEKEPLVEERTFRELRSAQDTSRGLHAYYQWRGGQHATNFVPAEVVERFMRPLPNVRVPRPFVPRSPVDYVLRELGSIDLEHLGLKRTIVTSGGTRTAPREGGEGRRRFRVPPAPGGA